MYVDTRRHHFPYDFLLIEHVHCPTACVGWSWYWRRIEEMGWSHVEVFLVTATESPLNRDTIIADIGIIWPLIIEFSSDFFHQPSL